jgi:hypothetical protein
MSYQLPRYFFQKPPDRFVVYGVIILFLLTLATVGILYPVRKAQEQANTNQGLNKNILKNRKGPLNGINGRVKFVTSDENKKTLAIESDLGQGYSIEINQDTKINEVSRKVGKKEVKITSKKISFKEVEEGKRVYVLTTKDLLEETTVPPEDIKSIEIYVD